MFRLLFFILGGFVVCCGGVLFFVDHVTLNPRSEQLLLGSFGMTTSASVERPHIIDPPEWMPFSLIGLGGVTFLYSVALPRRKAERQT